jgi:CheY-like chemotaxis protein
MKTNLRILLLEDSLADAKLIERELFRNGFDFSLTRAQTESEIRNVLASAAPDLVLSNHLLPQLDGLHALNIVHEVCPRMPFIFVSGSMDQELVHEMYEEGADDFIFKRDLQELGSAVAKLTGVQPEPVAMPADLDAPSPLILPHLCIPSSGVLSLCPRCHRARDESGEVVPLEDYCHHRIKSVVVRELCEDCIHAPPEAAPPPDCKPARLRRRVR